MWVGMCLGMCVDMCIDMWTDMCVDMYVGMCVDMRAHVVSRYNGLNILTLQQMDERTGRTSW